MSLRSHLSRFTVLFLAVSLFDNVGAEDEKAQWMGVKQSAAVNQWIAFRGQVVVPEDGVGTGEVRIAADTKYWLWIDGEMVVFEGGLKRGPTPESTYVDHLDLSKQLTPGQHTMAVLLWHFGKEGFSHKNSGKAGLLVDLPRPITASWKAITHPAFGNTADPHPNFRLPESNIRFDANLRMNGWTEAGFDDNQWPGAVVNGSEGDQPWGPLVRRPIPQWKDFGVVAYANDADLQLPRTSKGETFKARLPYNAQVTPVMTIRAKAGERIGIQTDNYRGGGPPNVRCVYLTTNGEQTYENLGWISGHEVHYKIPAGVEVLSLGYRETGFATELTGTFACDDPFLNRLREKAVRTLYITMRDTYFDCPDRERAQWWGDAVLELGESFYALDRNSDLLTRKAIKELMGWQRADGTIFSPVPAGNYKGELPMQMLASVGRYGFWTYALHSGDLETIREVYPAVKRYLSVWQQGDNGLVVPRSGGWTWGDWGQHKDMPLLFNGWYCLALDGQRLMAEQLGHQSDVAEAEAKIERLKQAFQKNFWTGNQYRSPDYFGATDDRGHALAVVAGIAQPEQYDAIAKVLQSQRQSSPYMEKYVMEALFRMGRPDQAIERCKQRYKKMVESELTTLWEGWGIGAEGFGGGTINHAWSGGPLTIMSQFMAGVSPTSLGYKTFDVAPQPGPLKQIKANIDSVAGPITVSIDQQAGQQTIRLASPKETQATVKIAKNGLKSIRINGQLAWESADRTTDQLQNQNFRIVSDNDQTVDIRVPAGNWTFAADR